MSYPTFPVSPLPADFSRTTRWGGTKVRFDSGARQANTAYVRPMYNYEVSFTNMPEGKRAQLLTLVQSVRGTIDPFWFPDPYDYVNSAQIVGTGITAGSANVVNEYGHLIRPTSVQVSTLYSTLSGYVSRDTHYTYNLNSAFITITTKNTGDTWAVQSLNGLFKKCSFDQDYADTAMLWQIWGTSIRFMEQL
jgi:hypothetical protein